jgi:hypothetical protein
MSVNGRNFLGGDSKSNSSLELDELPSFWEFEPILFWEEELETLNCFGTSSNSSVADSGLTESFHFQVVDSKK